MDVQFINTKKWGIDAEKFEICIKRLKKHVPKTEGILNVVFVDDAYIQSLNRKYRKKDKPTDVLSFSYLGAPDFKETKLIGEIYISVPTAKRNVGEVRESLDQDATLLHRGSLDQDATLLHRGGSGKQPLHHRQWRLQDELNKLFVHGALHIFGYDHETEEEGERMEGLEEEILS